MKKIAFSLLLLSGIAFTFTSCNNNDDDDEDLTPGNSTYYIEGKVDGVMHNASYVCPNTGCESSAANYIDFMHSISMQRTTSASDPIGWMINIDDVHLDAFTVPVTIYAGDFTAENFVIAYYKGTWDSDNRYESDYVVCGDSSFVLNVTSKAGDILEGTFSGEMRNGSDTDDRVTVTNGKFKIKLTRM